MVSEANISSQQLKISVIDHEQAIDAKKRSAYIRYRTVIIYQGEVFERSIRFRRFYEFYMKLKASEKKRVGMKFPKRYMKKSSSLNPIVIQQRTKELNKYLNKLVKKGVLEHSIDLLHQLVMIGKYQKKIQPVRSRVVPEIDNQQIPHSGHEPATGSGLKKEPNTDTVKSTSTVDTHLDLEEKVGRSNNEHDSQDDSSDEDDIGFLISSQNEKIKNMLSSMAVHQTLDSRKLKSEMCFPLHSKTSESVRSDLYIPPYTKKNESMGLEYDDTKSVQDEIHSRQNRIKDILSTDCSRLSEISIKSTQSHKVTSTSRGVVSGFNFN